MAQNNLNYLLYLFAGLCLTACGQQCSKNTNSYENYLGTKTPYRAVANTNSTEIRYEGCQAKKFWTLVRHGTRNPNLQLIERMRERLVEIRDAILEESSAHISHVDLDLFRKWRSKLQDKDEKRLTHEGEDEMLLLAERMQLRFPGIFGSIYSNTSYNFKFTGTQRTKRSAQYFAAGLFGRQTVRDVYFPEPLKKDPILRFYKLCNKWRREVSKNPASLLERRKFETGPIVGRMIKDVNDRLGFQDELDLSDVHTMYQVCAFETAWNKRKRSPWCSAFTIDDLKILEYAEDLKYYWVDGFGHELTYKQACPAFNDMIDFFQEKQPLPKVAAYFTHSGTILKMLAHMELYRDEDHLRAAGFKNSKRQWRVSQIDAFGSNLAFVLFNCNGTPKILTLHQEEVVRLPSCQNSDLCELRKVIRFYGESIDECAFDEMCDN